MSDTYKEVVDLVWGRPGGGGVPASLFRRWSQGFLYSEAERSALEQFEGGPCAVIAPVQAFLLKNILFNTEGSNWKDISEEEQRTVLCSTLSEILESACLNKTQAFHLATLPHAKTTDSSDITDSHPEPESSQPTDSPTALAAEELGFERFHSIIQKRTLRTDVELREVVLSLHDTWKNKFGVLLFLYSVILTKGIENIKNEIEDTSEPLIDPVYGHGSQSLINLLVTGHAVSNVWDGDRECSGMKLRGIHQQAPVGFLTLMESLRYCKVGTFLKSPKFPIWILGSETHLSVFFTKEMALVAPESPSEQARRVFQTFDPEDNGFILDTLLEDVMKALDLDSVIPDSFPVYHYNGLKQSNHNEKVSYVEGTSLVMGFEDPMVRTDDTPVKRCLQTKWPYIELLWTTERSPSLN
uniref:Ubiquitin carboxyl-terminal hydrolase MINDY n=1 Tax=Sinocyclocheilus grahami TaxID=75366 RepID=A0A672QE12_SINGR